MFAQPGNLAGKLNHYLVCQKASDSCLEMRNASPLACLAWASPSGFTQTRQEVWSSPILMAIPAERSGCQEELDAQRVAELRRPFSTSLASSRRIKRVSNWLG